MCSCFLLHLPLCISHHSSDSIVFLVYSGFGGRGHPGGLPQLWGGISKREIELRLTPTTSNEGREGQVPAR